MVIKGLPVNPKLAVLRVRPYDYGVITYYFVGLGVTGRVQEARVSGFRFWLCGACLGESRSRTPKTQMPHSAASETLNPLNG